MREQLKNILLCLLSAILLILSFPKPDLSFFAWFALVPWFFALQRQSPLRAFILSYLVGLAFFSGVVYWVNYVSSLGFTILVLYLALYFAIFGLLFSFSIRYTLYAIRYLLFLPCLWVALEFIRSHLFSGFAWAILGYSQYQTLPIIQISDITGAYGVSFLIVLVNVGIFQAISRVQSTEYRAQKDIAPKGILSSLYSLLSTLPWVLLPIILALSYGYFRLSQKPQGEKVKVAVVQGNIPQKMKWDPQARDYILAKYLRLTEAAALKQPDIIIWPETSVPGFLESERALHREISSLSKKVFPAYLLVGTPHEDQDSKIYNRATMLFGGEILRHYDKLHLVPFGEFIPWPGFFSRFSFASLIGNFTPGQDYTIFALSRIKSKVAFGVLICFEDVFAHLTRKFVQRGAGVLVNMTNDAWFEDSSEPYQHLQASVFRAIENRVNLVRSANTGVSCFIDPWGKNSARVSDSCGQDVLVEGENAQTLTIVPLSSFYTAFGDIFALLCLLVSGFFVIVALRKQT